MDGCSAAQLTTNMGSTAARGRRARGNSTLVGMPRRTSELYSMRSGSLATSCSRRPRREVIDGLAAEFGPAIQTGVLALTKDQTLLKFECMRASLEAIRKQPREIWLVKLADRITNLEPPPHAWTQEKRREYLAEAKLILEALGEASASLRRRFEQKLVEYETYCR